MRHNIFCTIIHTHVYIQENEILVERFGATEKWMTSLFALYELTQINFSGLINVLKYHFHGVKELEVYRLRWHSEPKYTMKSIQQNRYSFYLEMKNLIYIDKIFKLHGLSSKLFNVDH